MIDTFVRDKNPSFNISVSLVLSEELNQSRFLNATEMSICLSKRFTSLSWSTLSKLHSKFHLTEEKQIHRFSLSSFMALNICISLELDQTKPGLYNLNVRDICAWWNLIRLDSVLCPPYIQRQTVGPFTFFVCSEHLMEINFASFCLLIQCKYFISVKALRAMFCACVI